MEIEEIRKKLQAKRRVNQAGEMASIVETDDDSDNNRGSMWALDQKIDQPMDEEAGRLRNMYREKVHTVKSNCWSF